MKKIVLFIACSLDGFIAMENSGIDWLFEGDYGYKKFYSLILFLWGVRHTSLAFWGIKYPNLGMFKNNNP